MSQDPKATGHFPVYAETAGKVAPGGEDILRLMKKGLFMTGVFGRFLRRLRFPQLFGLAALLLVVNLFIPDPLPFLDEALLAILTVVLGQIRSSDDEDDGDDDGDEPPIKNVTPKD